MVCKRMTDGKVSYSSSKTKRQYRITRHYTCQSRYIVYLLTCLLCEAKPQYIGQTTKTMRERHYGHRNEIKRGEAGQGQHFHKHMVENGWDIDQVSEFIDLTIIASVDETRMDAKNRLDRLETDFQNRLMTMDFHGGMNERNDKNRGKKN